MKKKSNGGSFLQDFKYQVRILLIKDCYKTKDKKCWQEYEKIGILLNSCWECKIVIATMENAVEVPKKN